MGEGADFIQPGQPRRVELEDGQNLRGVVQDVLAPQALPTVLARRAGLQACRWYGQARNVRSGAHQR